MMPPNPLKYSVYKNFPHSLSILTRDSQVCEPLETMGTDVQDGLNGYNSCSLVDEMDTLSLFEPAQRPTHPSSSSTTNIPDEVLTRESFYVLGDENLSDALLEEGWSAVTDPYHRLAMFKRTLKGMLHMDCRIYR
jgi:hypothetical protein